MRIKTVQKKLELGNTTPEQSCQFKELVQQHQPVTEGVTKPFEFNSQLLDFTVDHAKNVFANEAETPELFAREVCREKFIQR
jgi:hypothetical protein